MAEALFETPNLDGLSIDPADYKVAAAVLRMLADYAQDKAMAMEMRLSGNINGALAVEASLDRLYKRLPKWARW